MFNEIRIGMLVPSSNTVLEPMTSAMVADLPGASVHFSRFEVREISLRDQALGQFHHEPILAAARLLSHAEVDVICWNGTSAGWMGFDSDVELCRRILAETGVPATSAILGMNDALRTFGVTKLALVTPYVTEVQTRIVDNYRAIGIECVAEAHLGITVNFDFGKVDPLTIANMVQQVAVPGVEAIAVYCTNLRGAHLASQVEPQGILWLDSVATAVWAAIRATGADPAPLASWGRLFGSSGVVPGARA